ncbi:MAG: hypothetical protein B9J98_06045 [Candidatus Terraquivivens tikiterensis]|uniref:UPF0145 protein B9J98_06045 n=1 Tax=Candidatus Terraquivivens tikiterensis TaxID=1980982 RepID=A0A2R7Y1U1_9ARCH|nr:MAG: hypothetical protein B9J98_06045 [Candidatus Terraquivivens tikiterensis]
MRSDVIAVTTQTVPGYRIVKVHGIVHGLTARTRGLGGKIVGGLQSIVGGEVSAFTKEIDKAKDEALKRLMEQAREIGASAVVGVDFETTEVFESVVLVAVYGTAVTIEPE